MCCIVCYSKKTLTKLTGVLYHYYDKKIDNLEHPLEFNGEINDNRNSGFPIERLLACENGNICKNSVYCFGYRVYLSKMKGAWNESRQDHQKRENLYLG